MASPLVIVLMGVAGSGKTTVGAKLAAALGWPFRDADEFHPPANIAKMSAGIPLTDEDRIPWLAAIRSAIDGCLARGESAVFACSALREAYRQKITGDSSRVKLVQLQGDPALILRRLGRRQGHFMKETMLHSQLETLEPPRHAIVIDVDRSPDDIVRQIRAGIGI